jgi:hypothetical protein
LGVRAFLLSFSSQAKRLELARHLLHAVSEIRQLAGDVRYVLTVSQTSTTSLRMGSHPKPQRDRARTRPPPRLDDSGCPSARDLVVLERLVRRRVREVSPKRMPETEEPTERNGPLITHLIDPRAHDF